MGIFKKWPVFRSNRSRIGHDAPTQLMSHDMGVYGHICEVRLDTLTSSPYRLPVDLNKYLQSKIFNRELALSKRSLTIFLGLLKTSKSLPSTSAYRRQSLHGMTLVDLAVLSACVTVRSRRTTVGRPTCRLYARFSCDSNETLPPF